MSNDIAERVKKIVVEHLGVDETKVTDSASFIAHNPSLESICLRAGYVTGQTLHVNGGMAMI